MSSTSPTVRAHRHRLPLPIRAVLCIGLLAGLLAACSQTEGAPEESPEEPRQAAVPELAWEDCEEGLECTTAEVPLDHDDPDGEQIELSLVRLPATNPEERIGSVFTNPGGPGLPGVATLRFWSASDALPERLTERFDVIGLDPRGVGESTPVRCFDSVEEQARFTQAGLLWPTRAEEVDPFVESREDLARRCAEQNGDLLDHLSTANVARDLDLLRAAVGDDELSFVGLSYGSYLGVTYASLFPDRVRAMVLDGATDPVGYTGAEGSDGGTPWLRSGAHLGTDETLAQFFELCAAAGEGCSFGADGDPEQKFADLVDRVTDAPLLLDVGADAPLEIGPAEVVGNTLSALYVPASDDPAVTDWSVAAATLQGYVELAAQPEGTIAPGTEAPPTPEAYNNTNDAQSASICVDGEHPDDVRGVGDAADEARDDSPYAADRWAWGISGVCPAWAGEDDDRYTGPFDPETANPVLVVGNRFDPATPYRNAEQLARDLPDAELLTLDGWGHTASFGNISSCIDDAVADYLITQELPAAGTTCEPDPAGVPFSSPPRG